MKSNWYTSVLLILMLIPAFVSAQDTRPNPDKPPKRPLSERLVFGGNFGLQMGTITNVDISPMIGYKVTERVILGVQPSYQYYRWRYRDQLGNDYVLKFSMYGGGIFNRILIADQFFTHVEYQILNLEAVDDRFAFPVTTSRQNVPFLWVGGGYSQALGGNANLVFYGLYDAIGDYRSPFPRFVPRIGVIAGF